KDVDLAGAVRRDRPAGALDDRGLARDLAAAEVAGPGGPGGGGEERDRGRGNAADGHVERRAGVRVVGEVLDLEDVLDRTARRHLDDHRAGPVVDLLLTGQDLLGLEHVEVDERAIATVRDVRDLRVLVVELVALGDRVIRIDEGVVDVLAGDGGRDHPDPDVARYRRAAEWHDLAGERGTGAGDHARSVGAVAGERL